MTNQQFWILILVLILFGGGGGYYGHANLTYGIGSVLVVIMFLKVFGVI